MSKPTYVQFLVEMRDIVRDMEALGKDVETYDMKLIKSQHLVNRLTKVSEDAKFVIAEAIKCHVESF